MSNTTRSVHTWDKMRIHVCIFAKVDIWKQKQTVKLKCRMDVCVLWVSLSKSVFRNFEKQVQCCWILKLRKIQQNAHTSCRAESSKSARSDACFRAAIKSRGILTSHSVWFGRNNASSVFHQHESHQSNLTFGENILILIHATYLQYKTRKCFQSDLVSGLMNFLS